MKKRIENLNNDKTLKTRFKDKNNNPIYIGDIVYVEEYPDKYVGGSYAYEGVIEEREKTIYVTYYDIGEEEYIPLSCFPKKGREVLSAEKQYNYWKTQLLGADPPKHLYDRKERAKYINKQKIVEKAANSLKSVCKENGWDINIYNEKIYISMITPDCGISFGINSEPNSIINEIHKNAENFKEDYFVKNNLAYANEVRCRKDAKMIREDLKTLSRIIKERKIECQI